MYVSKIEDTRRMLNQTYQIKAGKYVDRNNILCVRVPLTDMQSVVINTNSQLVNRTLYTNQYDKVSIQTA